MEIDLRSVPFSRNGAYLAFSILPAAGGWPAGLYLRSVHGGALAARPDGRLALVEGLRDGRVVPCRTSAAMEELVLRAGKSTLRICISEPYVVRVRGEGLGLRLTLDARAGDLLLPGPEGRWRVNSPGLLLQMMATAMQGCWQVRSEEGARLALELLPEQPDGACEGALEEYASSWLPRAYEEPFAECAAGVAWELEHWLEHMPALPREYEAARRLAAYILWSGEVEPEGHYLRPVILMSKNWMTNVWAWDHCFNALALSYHKQVAAWDQLMTLFDQQDENGALPDMVNDRSLAWNFCKPPVHGWALGWMMAHNGVIRTDQARQIYGPLCRWTEWWFSFRDDDRDGLPQYHHGNDSGWDNATPFIVGLPLESPDLCAFLILQMETLARLAAQLNDVEESESWQRRSEELLERLLAHFWQGDHFVALRSGDHLVADTESLFLYLPLILGKRLPQAVLRELIGGLVRPGRFLTPYGLATESPASPLYTPDGYWRGPIWAPATLLLVEGLAASGELDLARDIAKRFCDLVARNGCAENFDALTGAPLRDKAYTWTASVFLVLAHEYLTAD